MLRRGSEGNRLCLVQCTRKQCALGAFFLGLCLSLWNLVVDSSFVCVLVFMNDLGDIENAP